MKKQTMFALFASTCFTMAGGVLAPSSLAADADVQIVADDIGGVVSSAKGPEAGVWVIAETTDLPTRYIKIVVTDDHGRYVMPELPKAKYKVWVRGYGLVDSKPVEMSPGKRVDLTAVVAPDARAAAQYYPPNYWYALAHPPAATEFPGTGADGNGIAPKMKSQGAWLQNMKECMQCHQLGDKATRELADNSMDGWAHRIQQARADGDPSIGSKGPAYATTMQNDMAAYGRNRGLKMFSDWTATVAKGEIPEAPPRPAGVERNLVLTMWDWGSGSYLHDEVSTDRRNPTANANGPIYGIETNLGKLAILDPAKGTMKEVQVPGGEHGYVHTVMLDRQNRVWMPDIGPVFEDPKVMAGLPPNSDYCKNEGASPYAKYYPSGGKASQVHMYDPVSQKMTTIPTCALTTHLYFGHDDHDTVFFSGRNVLSWVDTKVWDETHDPSKAVGWCPFVIDTKEKGITKVAFGSDDSDVTITPDHNQWNKPGQPFDPKKDTLLAYGGYGLGVNPVDDSVWFGVFGYPGGVIRASRGAHPPETCKTEYYEAPKLPDGDYAAFAPHDVGFDSKGIAWVTFTSGQVGRFDRTKCKVTSGPAILHGDHCPEGWKIFDGAGPKFKGVSKGYGNADLYYQSFVDLYDTFGLGKDTPMVPGSNSDALMALQQDTGKWVTLRVPYPMGFFSRWMDGRIDNPNTGWKGKAGWATFSDVPVWHQEGGEDGQGAELVKFQLRPDPLAH